MQNVKQVHAFKVPYPMPARASRPLGGDTPIRAMGADGLMLTAGGEAITKMYLKVALDAASRRDFGVAGSSLRKAAASAGSIAQALAVYSAVIRVYDMAYVGGTLPPKQSFDPWAFYTILDDLNRSACRRATTSDQAMAVARHAKSVPAARHALISQDHAVAGIRRAIELSTTVVGLLAIAAEASEMGFGQCAEEAVDKAIGLARGDEAMAIATFASDAGLGRQAERAVDRAAAAGN